MEKQEAKWRSQNRGEFAFSEMCKAIKEFIEQDPHSNYTISVGTDSQKHKGYKNNGYTRFVTAIMVHRVGKGGQYYILSEENEHIYGLRHKIMYEVSLTYQFKEMLKNELNDFLALHDIHIKPHADVGEHGETRKLISEIKGMFKGFGIEEEVEIKPYSTAASSIANKFSK